MLIIYLIRLRLYGYFTRLWLMLQEIESEAQSKGDCCFVQFCSYTQEGRGRGTTLFIIGSSYFKPIVRALLLLQVKWRPIKIIFIGDEGFITFLALFILLTALVSFLFFHCRLLPVRLSFSFTIEHNRAANVNGLASIRFSLVPSSYDVFPIEQPQFLKQGPCQQESEEKFVSYCSCDADRRGLNQNVIAYSLYGNFSNPRHFARYADPFKIILANISQSYPGSKGGSGSKN